MKKLLIKIRTSIKLIILLCIATFIILATVALVYKPIYSVYIDGELVGYCADKAKLQSKISSYIENGNEDNDNLAYVSVDNMPTYKLCLLKRDVTTTDEEIFEKIVNTGVSYYKYFAVLDKEEEKAYVATYEQAESIVNKLKEKESNNIDDISITEKYETELKEFSSEDDVVSDLYVEKPKPIVVATTNRSSDSSRTSGTLQTSSTISKAYVDIGISLIRPITGTISSKFGSISSIRSGAHTGLDIAAPTGTSIKAAASGTVTYSDWRGSSNTGYGKLLVISHGNGVQTYYAHCSKLYASVGDEVSQGDVVAAVGSTGNSTGSHLHLEVRVNGVAYNPQNYVY